MKTESKFGPFQIYNLCLFNAEQQPKKQTFYSPWLFILIGMSAQFFFPLCPESSLSMKSELVRAFLRAWLHEAALRPETEPKNILFVTFSIHRMGWILNTLRSQTM